MKSTNRSLLFILIHIIIYYLDEWVAGYTTTSLENTIGLSLVDGQSTFTDNTIVLRAVRLDSTNGVCNEPRISFRIVVPGEGAIVQVVELDDNGNARIPLESFCAPPPSKRKRGYIFYDNYKREISRRPRRYYNHFDKRTTDKSKSSSKAKSDDSSEPKAAAPSDSGGDSTPKSGSGGDSGAPKSDSGGDSGGKAAAPKGSDSGSDSKKAPTKTPKTAAPSAGPKAVGDKIKVLTFYNELVLIYYPCGGQVCGDIYSIKNIKTLVKTINLAGNCDETTAVQGPNGFLYLCYHEVDSSIVWESWTTNGAEFDKAYTGSISNVTIPNKLKGEHFNGALFKVFSSGSSKYSIVMGSFGDKPIPQNPGYNPPIELFAYLLTDATIISGPHPIYQNIQNIGPTPVQFLIQTCNPIASGGGYKCLLSIKSTESITKYISITFSETGEQTSTVPFEFDITHAPGAKTPATLSLNNGGWCIGVVTDGLGLDCLVYDEGGIQHGTWGIPTGAYGQLGSTPNNIMWAVQEFTDQSSYTIHFSNDLVGFNGNVA